MILLNVVVGTIRDEIKDMSMNIILTVRIRYLY